MSAKGSLRNRLATKQDASSTASEGPSTHTGHTLPLAKRKAAGQSKRTSRGVTAYISPGQHQEPATGQCWCSLPRTKATLSTSWSMPSTPSSMLTQLSKPTLRNSRKIAS